MNDVLERLTTCIELGKINKAFPFPAEMKGGVGAEELCKIALEQGIAPEEIRNKALIPGMSRIGEKYSQGKAFVPEMLISAKAMSAAMKHLKPFFTSGAIERRGVFVIGASFSSPNPQVAVAVMWISNYLVSWTFPMLDKSTFLTTMFHHGFSYWLYGFMAILAALFMWKWVPETK